MPHAMSILAITTSLLTMLWPARALADTVRLLAQKDTTLYSEDGALSNGAGDHIFTGRTDQDADRHALIAFDIVSAVPPGSTVTSVTLSLNLSRTRTQSLDVSLHRVTTPWGEGASHAAGEEGAGAPAQTGDATWTHSIYPTTMWTAAGGDYNPVASATTTISNQSGFYTWSSAQLAADVQGWLDAPATSEGWVLAAATAATKETKRFDSRQNADQTKRPFLDVTFTPPAGTGACCAADGGCTVVLDPGGSCPPGGYQGVDTVCSPNPCPQPAGACCLPDAAATCDDTNDAAWCLGMGGTFRGPLTTCIPDDCPVVLTPWLDALPLPGVAQPVVGTPGGAADYQIAIVQFTQQLHAELPPTTVWGFDDGTTGGTTPGPTIEAHTDAPVNVTWLNDLRDSLGVLRTSHFLPVDPCPHGAETDAARTVIHLHGGHVPAEFDGYPEHTFLPGEQVLYQYPNWQEAATLWYHDHALGITRLNVTMGMAGFYILRDDFEDALGLPAGEFEVPLAIQDRSFNADGSLRYPASWQPHFFGDHIMVNGKVWPFLDVKRGKYRFRMLNGSTSRTYTLALSTADPFVVIGGDGGLLDAPVAVTELTIAPGERADVVMDFEGYPASTEIFLVNSAPAPFPGTPGAGVVPDVMKFVVVDAPGHTAALPPTLRPTTPLDELQAVQARDFELDKVPDACAGEVWLINGLGWNDITELPRLGTIETWRFINLSGAMHPMHMHLVFFQVLDRTPFELVGGVPTATGPPVPPAPEESGWKDTVQVAPAEMVRVVTRFDDFLGRYPYHCHILEHEDHEMMRQFETTTVCGDGARGIPLEGCDDGNQNNSDSCPDGVLGTCQPAFCGDRHVWNTDDGTEECDDGNNDPGDGCGPTCLIEAAQSDGSADGPIPDAQVPDGPRPDAQVFDGPAMDSTVPAEPIPDGPRPDVQVPDGPIADARPPDASIPDGPVADMVLDSQVADADQTPDGISRDDGPPIRDDAGVTGDSGSAGGEAADGCGCAIAARPGASPVWSGVALLGVVFISLRRRRRSSARDA